MTSKKIDAPRAPEPDQPHDGPAVIALQRVFGHMRLAMAEIRVLEAHLDPTGTALRRGDPLRTEAEVPEPESRAVQSAAGPPYCCTIRAKGGEPFATDGSHGELLRLLSDTKFVNDAQDLLTAVEEAAIADDKDLTDFLVHHFADFEFPEEVYELVRQLEEILEWRDASHAAWAKAQRELVAP